MSFYETPRRNASDGSGASNRSTNRGHRREHSDPCPLPSPGLPHKALSTPELLRSKTVGDPCSAIRRSCSSLAALRGLTPEPVPPNADGYARIIFFMVRFRERDVLKRSRFQAGEARGSKKKNNVQAVLRQEKHKQLQDTFEKGSRKHDRAVKPRVPDGHRP